MAHQPLDGAREDGTMSRHKALGDPMMGRWRRLLLLIPSISSNGWAYHLLSRTVVLCVDLSLGSSLKGNLLGS